MSIDLALTRLAGTGDRRLDAIGPGLAVPGEHGRSAEGLELAERGKALLARLVERRGHDLGAAAAVERVPGDQLVAGEQSVLALEVQDAVAGRVPGRVDDTGPAGDVEHVS